MIDLAVIPAMFFSLFAGDDLPSDTISIDGANPIANYEVEIADNPFHHLKGLMDRPTLPDNGGMLFLYDQDTIARMWMKNVAFPLDILFLDRCGRIVQIHRQAQPDDPTIIASKTPVRAVLELPGGASKRDEIEVGDKVNQATFTNATDLC